MKPPGLNDQKSAARPRDPDLVGAEAALKRAAERARRRAAMHGGAIATFKDGKVVWERVDPDPAFRPALHENE